MQEFTRGVDLCMYPLYYGRWYLSRASERKCNYYWSRICY